MPPNTNSITNNVRSLPSDPGAALTFNSMQTNTALGGSPQSPSAEFGLKLMDLLKRHQTMGTRPFQEQGLNAQQEQVNRVMQTTPTDLVGSSPNVQSGVRNASVGAVSPTIQGAQQSTQTFSEQLRGFGDALSQAQGIGQWLQEQEQSAQTEARNLIFQLPGAVKRLPDQEKRILEQKAGLQKGFIDILPEGEEEATWSDPFPLGGNYVQKNSRTGEIRIASSIPQPKDGGVGDAAAGISDVQKSLDTIDLFRGAITKAKQYYGASGRSGGRQFLENWLVGSTDFTNLVALTNTLRTNVLTLFTDPAVRKFFGPQMSNADIQLMTAGGTTLNPELQDPAELLGELERLEDLGIRMEKAVKSGVGTFAQTPSAPTAQNINLMGNTTGVMSTTPSGIRWRIK